MNRLHMRTLLHSLFHSARARDIKDVVIGDLVNLGDALPGLRRRLRVSTRAI
jgi:hypothetical protein